MTSFNMQTITSLAGLLFAASFAAAIPTTNEARAVLLAPRYTPGRCGIHVVQEQKNEIGNSEYLYTVTFYDGAGAYLGTVTQAPIGDYQTLDLYSQLPYPLAVTSGGVDSDPVNFSYDGYAWNSNNGCSTGNYDDRSRQMDCGFGC